MDRSGDSQWQRRLPNSLKLPARQNPVGAWQRLIELGLTSEFIGGDFTPDFYPLCRGFAFNAVGSIRFAGRVLLNERVIFEASADEPAACFVYNADLPFAARIKVETLGATGKHIPWRIAFDFGEHGQSFMNGGLARVFSSIGEYAHNGEFTIPLPQPWRYPFETQSRYDLTYRYTTGITLSQPFDFLVIEYDWSDYDGQDLDTRTAVSTPARLNDVGWDRYDEDPEGEAVGDAYLIWGGDNTDPSGAEAVLIDFAKLAADNAGLATLAIRLRAFWYGNKGTDGRFKLRLQPYLGGSMSQVGLGFANSGGTALTPQVKEVQVETEISSNVDGDDVGAITYNVADKTAVLS